MIPPLPEAGDGARRRIERAERGSDWIRVFGVVWVVTQSYGVVLLCAGALDTTKLPAVLIVWCVAVAAGGGAALATVVHWSALSWDWIVAELTPWGLYVVGVTAILALTMLL